jgi:hypothetical protein
MALGVDRLSRTICPLAQQTTSRDFDQAGWVSPKGRLKRKRRQVGAPDTDEIDEVAWCTAAEAQERLTSAAERLLCQPSGAKAHLEIR